LEFEIADIGRRDGLSDARSALLVWFGRGLDRLIDLLLLSEQPTAWGLRAWCQSGGTGRGWAVEALGEGEEPDASGDAARHRDICIRAIAR